jgi:hypothetical protein
MLFNANSNRKFSASLFDEMFDMEVENTRTLSNHQQLIEELEKVKIETANKTIEELLEELLQKEQEVFEMYSFAHTNYSIIKNKQTLYFKNIQASKIQIKEVAVWLYNDDTTAMSTKLRSQLIEI